MQGMGVKGLYMTPHIIHGAYDNRGEEELRQRFADFGYQGPLDIRLGAEYFIDDKFPEHLEGNPLTMNCRHVLVEFSINGYSLRAFDMLFEATLSGYEIILAHPERYAFVQANGKDKVINLIKQYKLAAQPALAGRIPRQRCEEICRTDAPAGVIHLRGNRHALQCLSRCPPAGQDIEEGVRCGECSEREQPDAVLTAALPHMRTARRKFPAGGSRRAGRCTALSRTIF